MITFIVALVPLLLIASAAAGWVLHQRWHEAKDQELNSREAVLDERCRELEQIHRIQTAFWQTRSQLLDEAIEAQRDKFGDIT